MSVQVAAFPRAFVFRRLHSLMGFWIVLFLIEHLVTNSQAVLLISQYGEGFIRAVNVIKHLPYLPVIEIVLLGVPIVFHMGWGIKYAIDGKINSFKGRGIKPSLPRFSRNHAYSMQRISSWIILIGLIGHVAYMRFYMYPIGVHQGRHSDYFVRIDMDGGLYQTADRLGVKIYDQFAIDSAKAEVRREIADSKRLEKDIAEFETKEGMPTKYQPALAELVQRDQVLQEKQIWLQGLEKRKLSKGQVIAEAPDFGTATLLVVRNSFRNLWIAILYTVFVLATVFHAFNGLWTFMITWGIVLKMRSQSQAVNWCVGLMVLIGFLGLVSIWGTYLLDLLH